MTRRTCLSAVTTLEAVRRLGRIHLVAGLWLIGASPTQAADLRVAVASNFTEVAKVLAAQFKARQTDSVILVSASTGKQYTQIVHGAPFDIFLAADSEHPQRLEQEGHAVTGTRFTYAIGKLVLWSPQAGFVDRQGRVLRDGRFQHLALANPRLAPYGRAAREVLMAQGLWASLQDRLVRGENIAQTFQYIDSGNANLGFVALSQIRQPGRPLRGSYWMVPATLYTPIRQQAVLLRESPAGRAFLEFLRSAAGMKIIRDYGYDTDDKP